MKLKKTAILISFSVVAIVALLGVAVYANVQAKSNDVISGVIPTGWLGSHAGGPGSGNNDQLLANALGISVENLQTAYTTANNKAIDEALKAGTITQAQADALKSKGEGLRGLQRFMPGKTTPQINYDSLLADALGIPVEKLQQAYKDAYVAGIDQALKDGRITQEQADTMKGRYALANNSAFQSSMQSAFEAAVKKAVTDGVITQAQADQILKNNTNTGSGFFGFGGKGRGGFPGGPEMGRGRGGKVPGDRNKVQPTATPGASS